MKKTVVSIRDFGAECSDQLQTEKIQAAIDYCFEMGGGEVQIPEGVYLTGSIRLRSNITLHLLKNAVLKGSRNPDDYYTYRNDKLEPLSEDLISDETWGGVRRILETDPNYKSNYFTRPGSRWNHGIIRAVNAHNISVIGEEGSLIDGSNCYDEIGEEWYRGPHAMNMYYCKNVYLRGYTVQDSGNWANTLVFCENIDIDNIEIRAGHDGVHVTSCTNVNITNSRFYTGDDSIAGFGNTNVYVSDCEINSACSAFRFGGTNVFVERCHIFAPCKYLFRCFLTKEQKERGENPDVNSGYSRRNMLSVFTYYSDFSIKIKHAPGNIIFSDCKIEGADRFLHFNYSGNEQWQKNRPLESVTFKNIEAVDISMPLTAYGDVDNKFRLSIENSNITFREGAEVDSFMRVCNHDKITLKNVNVKNFKGDCLIKTWSDDGKVEFDNFNCDISEDKLIKKAEEVFTCKPI